MSEDIRCDSAPPTKDKDLERERAEAWAIAALTRAAELEQQVQREGERVRDRLMPLLVWRGRRIDELEDEVSALKAQLVRRHEITASEVSASAEAILELVRETEEDDRLVGSAREEAERGDLPAALAQLWRVKDTARGAYARAQLLAQHGWATCSCCQGAGSVLYQVECDCCGGAGYYEEEE